MNDIPRTAVSRRHKLMIFITLALGMVAGLILAELGLRAWLSLQFRHTIKNLPQTVPQDPNANLAFRQLLNPTTTLVHKSFHFNRM